MKNNLLLCTLGCSIALTINGCGSGENATQTIESTSTLIEYNPNFPTYTMAIKKDYPPFVQLNEYGQPIGFDVDLMNAIGDKSQFNVTIDVIEWESAFDGLQAGKYQMLGSGISISPEQQSKFDFSDAYATGKTAFATINPKLQKSEDVINQKIGVQRGSDLVDKMHATYANKNELVQAQSLFLACRLMMIGTTDVCVGDINRLNHFKNDFKNEADIHIFTAIQSDDRHIAFAIEKGNREVADKLNAGLKQVKADGTYDKLHTKWFGE